MKRGNHLSVYATDHPLSIEIIPELMRFLDAGKYLVMCEFLAFLVKFFNMAVLIQTGQISPKSACF